MLAKANKSQLSAQIKKVQGGSMLGEVYKGVWGLWVGKEWEANALVRCSICNNAAQPVSFQLQQFRTSAKGNKYKIYIYDIRSGTFKYGGYSVAKLHLEFAIWSSLRVCMCVFYAFVFFLFACCLFLSCKMHFTFYCALNQKSISVFRLCGLWELRTDYARDVLWTDCGPGTVHVYSRKICQHVWVAGRWTDEWVLAQSLAQLELASKVW